MRKPTIWVSTRSDPNRAVQSQEMVIGWIFWKIEESLFFLFFYFLFIYLFFFLPWRDHFFFFGFVFPGAHEGKTGRLIFVAVMMLIGEARESYYPCSENKGTDRLRSYCEADLRLCFRLCKMLVFPCGGSYFEHISHISNLSKLK